MLNRYKHHKPTIITIFFIFFILLSPGTTQPEIVIAFEGLFKMPPQRRLHISIFWINTFHFQLQKVEVADYLEENGVTQQTILILIEKVNKNY